MEGTVESVYSSYACKYLEMGYQPIPVMGKEAVLKGWQLYSRTAMDEITLRQIEGRYQHPDMGVAFVCGLGVFAIDIDTDDARLDILDLIPATPMRKRGATGFTVFYRYNGEELKSQRSRVFPIEMLGTGAYSVVPPSPHPSSESARYIWQGEEASLSDLTLIEDPEALFEKLKRFCLSHSILRPVKSARPNSDEGNVIDPDNKAKPVGLGVGSRNQHLSDVSYAMACQMKQHGKTEHDLAIDLLAEDDRAHGDRAWFRDPAEHRNKLTPLARAEQMVSRAVKKASTVGDMLEKYEIKIGPRADVKITEGGEGSPPEELPRLAVEEVPGLVEIASPNGYAALINQVPLLKMYAAYIEQKAPKHYSPALTMGSGLVLLGASASNLYHVNEATPNLLVLNCAVTGFGKDIVQKCLKRILNDVRRTSKIDAKGEAVNGAYNYVGFSRYSSSNAIYKNLAQNNRRIRVDVQDEVSYLLGKITDKRGPLSGAIETMSELWSATHDILEANAVMDKDRKIQPVANPCLLWLGSTTPIGMKEILDNEVLSKGLGSRMLYFIENRTLLDMDEPFRLKRKDLDTVPQGLFGPLSELLTREPAYLDPEININEPPSLKRIKVEEPMADREGLERWLGAKQKEILKYCSLRAERSGGDLGQEDRVTIMLTRRVEMILRLLSVWFVGHGCERPIETEALEWANQICSYSLGNVEAYAQRAGESVVDKAQRAIRAKYKGKPPVKRARIMEDIRKVLQQNGAGSQFNLDSKIEAEMRRSGYVQDAGHNGHRQPLVCIM
jgi:hypothetical protein